MNDFAAAFAEAVIPLAAIGALAWWSVRVERRRYLRVRRCAVTGCQRVASVTVTVEGPPITVEAVEHQPTAALHLCSAHGPALFWRPRPGDVSVIRSRPVGHPIEEVTTRAAD